MQQVTCQLDGNEFDQLFQINAVLAFAKRIRASPVFTLDPKFHIAKTLHPVLKKLVCVDSASLAPIQFITDLDDSRETRGTLCLRGKFRQIVNVAVPAWHDEKTVEQQWARFIGHSFYNKEKRACCGIHVTASSDNYDAVIQTIRDWDPKCRFVVFTKLDYKCPKKCAYAPPNVSDDTYLSWMMMCDVLIVSDDLSFWAASLSSIVQRVYCTTSLKRDGWISLTTSSTVYYYLRGQLGCNIFQHLAAETIRAILKYDKVQWCRSIPAKSQVVTDKTFPDILKGAQLQKGDVYLDGLFLCEHLLDRDACRSLMSTSESWINESVSVSDLYNKVSFQCALFGQPKSALARAATFLGQHRDRKSVEKNNTKKETVSNEKETYSHVDHRGVPLDHKLLKYLPNRKGFFIEAGANDGITQSNTKLLESKYGWTGLLVEPSPIAFKKCQENRDSKTIIENCGLVSPSFVKDYVEGDFDGNLMSSVDGSRLSRRSEKVRVPAITLSALLDKHKIKEIDFFSLDTEGYELEILQGLDMTRHRPRYMLIEIYETDKSKLFDWLKQRQYRCVDESFSGYNKQDNPSWDGTHNDYLFQDSMSDFHKSMAVYTQYDPFYESDARKTVIAKYERFEVKKTGSKRIPHIIHQVWLGSSLPDKNKEFQKTWQQKHPNWQYKLWTDQDVEDFGLVNKAAYDRSKNFGERSDIARYEILEKFGGLYIDTDFECLQPFDALHDSIEFFAGLAPDSEPFTVFNGMFGCAKNHPFLRQCIQAIAQQPPCYETTLNANGIMNRTGPYFFGKQLSLYMPSHSDWVVLPLTWFFPWPNSCMDCRDRKSIESYFKPESLAVHHWHTSWMADSATVTTKALKSVISEPAKFVSKELKSYSQARQDSFVYHLLVETGLQPKGTFLDIASGDPIKINNSYALESQFGWRGLLLDYDEKFTEITQKARTSPFVRDDAIKINWKALLAKHFDHAIDYLSFDFDNNAIPVFEVFPWNEIRFKVITIEHDSYQFGTKACELMRATFTKLGYSLICRDVTNEGNPYEDWWVDPKQVDMRVAARFSANKMEWTEIFKQFEAPRRGIVYYQLAGRLGNNVFQYMAAELVCCICHKAGVQFVTHKPSNVKVIDDQGLIDLVKNPKEIERDIYLDGYFQRSDIFGPKREFFKSFMNSKNTTFINETTRVCDLLAGKAEKEELVIHVRLDDYNFSGTNSNILHPDVYLGIIKKLKPKQVVIVVDQLKSEHEKKYIEALKKCGDFRLQQGTISEDFACLMNANTIIVSHSTFAHTAAFLGNSSRVYIPYNTFYGGLAGSGQHLASFDDSVCTVVENVDHIDIQSL